MKVFCSFFVMINSFSATLTNFFFSTNLTQFLLKKGGGGICLSLRRARHSELILKLYPSLSLSYRGGTFMSRPRDRIFKDLCSYPMQTRCAAMAEKCNSKRLNGGPFCLFQVTTSSETKESQSAQNQQWGSRYTAQNSFTCMEKWKLNMAELRSDYIYCLETRNSGIKIRNWFMLQTQRNKNHPPFRLDMTFGAWDVWILTPDIPNQLLVTYHHQQYIWKCSLNWNRLHLGF